jgi:hypothetical protein
MLTSLQEVAKGHHVWRGGGLRRNYPRACEHGHRWGPGKVIVSWSPRDCDPAAAEPGCGHLPGARLPVMLVPTPPRTGDLYLGARSCRALSRTASPSGAMAWNY